MRKNLTMGVGKYYFNVYSGHTRIMINRKTKEAAASSFLNYKKNGKSCEWLGCWNGKSFDDSSTPSHKS